MSNQSKRIIFIHNSPILMGIFDSEALTFLRQVRRYGWTTDMILFVDPDWRERKDYMAKIEEIRTELGEGRLCAIERPPEYRGFKVFRESLYPALSELLKDQTTPRVIHCMGYLLTYSVLGAKRDRFPSLRVHADMRGVLPEESLYYGNEILPFRIIKYLLARKMERVVVRGADSLNCVSRSFKTYLCDRYKIAPEKIIVTPLCIDPEIFRFSPEERASERRRLGWEKSLVFTYSGKSQKWQLIPQMMRNLVFLLERIPNSRAAILSRTLKPFQIYVNALPGEMRERFDLRSLSQQELPGFLMASDIALLLRKEDLVNRVACPTKFAEYLGCGLPVLCTQGIGDISEMVRSGKLGWMMKDPFSREELESVAESIRKTPDEFFSNEARMRRSKAAADYFSWNKWIENVIDRYERLIRI